MNWSDVNRYLATVIGLVIVAASLLFAFVGIRTDPDIISPLDEFYSNFSTELFSIGFTVLVIDGLNRLRSQEDEKQRLIVQMGSPNNEFAIEAVRILRQEKWWMNGALHKIYLSGANLTGANLSGAHLRITLLSHANLSGANLSGADLRDANLWDANLSGANLRDADLRDANLWEANLSGANLSHSSLGGANLTDADLLGADLTDGYMQFVDLRNAHLEGAKLRNAKLMGTTLPDGTELPNDNTWEAAWLRWLEKHPELEIKYGDEDEA